MKREEKSSPGVGKGVIQNASGDPNCYLGHFRQSKVMREGHNRHFNMPGGIVRAIGGGASNNNGASA